jgi:hypothetical protein
MIEQMANQTLPATTSAAGAGTQVFSFGEPTPVLGVGRFSITWNAGLTGGGMSRRCRWMGWLGRWERACICIRG